MLLEEPASTSGTLSSLQHLSKDICFGDQFFNDKPLDTDKNAETKVELMLNIPIQQAVSSISLMTSPIIDLTSRPVRVSEPTASSFHDESPYDVLRQSDSEEESEKIVLGAKKGGQDEGQAGPDPDAQAEDQTGSNAGAQAEGQARSNPDETSEGQVGPDPDEGFTATVYLNVQENLKLAVEEPVLLEEPASSSGTLSSLQHLSRDFSFGDQFFSDKHSNADKNAETKVESMVNVTIQQALSSISLMTSLIIDLTSRLESPKEHQQLKATTTDTTKTTTMLPPPQAPQQSMTEAMMVKRISELEHILADLIQVNKTMKERLDKHGSRL
nr:hypothetical protein [Tanacetum cinerariifolium]